MCSLSPSMTFSCIYTIATIKFINIKECKTSPPTGWSLLEKIERNLSFKQNCFFSFCWVPCSMGRQLVWPRPLFEQENLLLAVPLTRQSTIAQVERSSSTLECCPIMDAQNPHLEGWLQQTASESQVQKLVLTHPFSFLPISWQD